ncbi:P-loop containing nucleoside triphosphate hydrolase protein [Aureobasidium pullulans EXF-150]|uniref:p-loop containing nucleoside triphosphate hydrolase protein n=1 Tax=Aureobasidium pullulans EXF-150 TaxID=1043002 RepID=A0A074XBQ4_AURPU|nr:P-loop containing nucleoside triphosphate hydrolase protein [Aureobasidium pullulans EXF-150]KEQ79482.1 P-loop containing nucleoside triphosphate hydrolase protein [Aureobasidium pullulans EXF-150]
MATPMNGRRFYGDPTIYALSTAPGRAAIAIIRISGSACKDIYHSLCPGQKPLKPRYAAVRTLYRPWAKPSPDNLLDSSALVLYFPAPKTVTGEDLLELHVHGGTAVVRAVLAAISQCSSAPGAIRYAEAGEFTRRAFMNDRLDLTQVEALGDTLSANTEQQRRLSVRGTTNNLSIRYESWRKMLLAARGELEALIDFSEDQHFDESPSELASSVADQVQDLVLLIDTHRRNAMRGELLRNGIAISLLGAPNAGKSSLLNRIVGREAAIVSQEAGTTRDVVEVGIDLGGYLCRLGDTAGLRSAVLATAKAQQEHMQEKISMIEEEGMRRAKQRAIESDVVIAVLSLELEGKKVVLKPDQEVIDTAAELAEQKSNVLVVLNKIDLLSGHASELENFRRQVADALPHVRLENIFAISCRDAEIFTAPDAGHIPSFLSGLIRQFEDMTSAVAATDDDTDASIWQESLGATERHRLLLDECQFHLEQFLGQVEAGTQNTEDSGLEEIDVDIVLAAENLRDAANCLARITGKGEAGDVEEVLGVVFEKFCVGK